MNYLFCNRGGVAERSAAQLKRQKRIDKENVEIAQRIDSTKARVDCTKPKSMGQWKSTFLKSVVINNRETFKKNNELLTFIRQAKPRIVSNAESRKHDKKHYKDQIFTSKYPKYLKERIELRNDNPLIINAGLPKNVRLKKSKCYMDIVDTAADRWLGRLTIEVYDGVVPKTADNFLALCERRGHGGYGGTQFFHIVPGLFCLGGDVEYSVGLGGTSATVTRDGRRYFADENHELSHNAPGTLSMYNFDRNQNASQFLITFRPLTTMDGRYVVFGRVISGFNALELIENSGLPSGKPKRKIIISNCGKT